MRYRILSPLLFFLAGCGTFSPDGPVETIPPSSSRLPSPQTGKSVREAEREIAATLAAMDETMQALPRDIDDPQWVAAYLNYAAAKDLFLVEAIHGNLKYAGWDRREREEFLLFYWGTPAEPGALRLLREESFRELRYLAAHSIPLADLSWPVRSRFDEKSEFSYWYLSYQALSIDPAWVRGTILPVMRELILQDELTPVSYLWLKDPASLKETEGEILQSGYPWSLLIHLLRMSREIQEMEEGVVIGRPLL